ncbi:MAG: protein-glutamine glutaminase family protein [Bacteriovoracaceae bacterium]
MLKIFLPFALLFTCVCSFASHLDSAVRDKSISYQTYFDHAYDSINKKMMTPLSVAHYFDETEEIDVVDWDTYEKLLDSFFYIRDLRFLKWSNDPKFPRRPTWLYPDDGCYTRASLVNKLLNEKYQRSPNKIFAFGNLAVKTSNSPSGYVYWWYHVVPIVKINHQSYVLDPAINPKKPLMIKDWLSKMGNPKEIKISICSSGTYSPRSDCRREVNDENFAVRASQNFLNLEWRRIKSLERDPFEELGDRPPWKD